MCVCVCVCVFILVYTNTENMKIYEMKLYAIHSYF